MIENQNKTAQFNDVKSASDIATKAVGMSSFKETTDDKFGYRRIDIYRRLEDAMRNSQSPEEFLADQKEKFDKIRQQKVNILLVGATGSGKSSTINALFDMEVAEVGYGVDPQTKQIAKYSMDNLVIWDSPGLGDSKANDQNTINGIAAKLNEIGLDGKPLIDLVIVILDASSKDLSAFYELMNKVLVPELKEAVEERVLITLNQSDLAMKGKHWNSEVNEPDEKLKQYLKDKVASIKQRIKENNNIDIEPVYYCAGYTEEDGPKRRPYNLTKLFYSIVQAIPNLKRFALIDNINSDENNWRDDDGEADYRAASRNQFYETLWLYVTDGAEDGAEIGSRILGIPGKIVGGAVGGVVGAIQGVIEELFD